MGPLDVYTDQEANRLSQIMVNDPHFAANELRDQLSQLDPQTASVLIAKTKNNETAMTNYYGPGQGDLQIQPEYDQYGRDTGYRNVTMASPDGIEQIAEIQARRPNYGEYGYGRGEYGSMTLGLAAGIIVGDLLFQRGRGVDFDDDRYRGWCNREQGREQYWNQNNGQFQQQWADPNFRRQYQQAPSWQQTINNPQHNNTYITNNRIDTTTINRTVNNTTINETINNTQQRIGHPVRPAAPPVIGAPIQTGRPPQNEGGDGRQHMPAPVGTPAPGTWNGGRPVANPGERPPIAVNPNAGRMPAPEQGRLPAAGQDHRLPPTGAFVPGRPATAPVERPLGPTPAQIQAQQENNARLAHQREMEAAANTARQHQHDQDAARQQQMEAARQHQIEMENAARNRQPAVQQRPVEMPRQQAAPAPQIARPAAPPPPPPAAAASHPQQGVRPLLPGEKRP